MGVYHVTLNGQGYLIDLQSYRREVAQPFPPKQAAGDRSYADLQPASAWALRDFAGGLGGFWWEAGAANRWRAGHGLDTTRRNRVTLGRPLVSAFDSGTNAVRGLQPAGNRLLALGGATPDIWETLDGSTWATSHTWTGKEAILGHAIWKEAVWLGNSVDGAVLKATVKHGGDTGALAWSTAFTVVTAGIMGIGAICPHITPDPTTGVPRHALYLGSVNNAGASLYETVDGSLPGAPLVTLVLPRIDALVSYRGDLLIANGRRDGEYAGRLYSYDAGAGTLRLLGELQDDYWAAGAVYGDAAYFGTGRSGQLWRWDGSRLALVHDLGESLGVAGALVGLVAYEGRLWLGVKTSEDGIGLAAWDGQGMHFPCSGAAGEAAGEVAAWNGSLYLATSEAGAGKVLRRSGTGYRTAGQLDTPWFDGGLVAAAKAWRRLTVVHAALGSGESVGLRYSTGGGYVSAGTSGTEGATSASFALSGVASTRLGLRLELAGNGSSTPEVHGAIVEYQIQPPLKRRWEFEALLEGTPELPLVRLDGSAEPLTGAELSAALWAARSAPGPVSFVDVDGASYSVWFADLVERLAQRSQRGGSGPAALRGRVVLVEA